MKKIFLPVVAATLIGSTAFAADLPARAPAMAPAPMAMPIFTWAGFYVGAQVGYGWGKGSVTTFNAAGAQLGSGGVNPAGVLGGVHAGVNFQSGSFVYGFEGDVEGSGVRKNNLVVNGTKLDESVRASLRLRGGIAMDRALVYLTGGVGIGNLKDTFQVGVTQYTVSNTRVGWTLGAGVEYAFTNNLSGRIEYRYSDLGRVTDGGLPAAFAPAVSARVKYTDSAVRLGLSYHFNTAGSPVVSKY